MQNYPDKFRIIHWDSFDVTCKNVRAIFTHCFNFTGASIKVPKLEKFCFGINAEAQAKTSVKVWNLRRNGKHCWLMMKACENWQYEKIFYL